MTKFMKTRNVFLAILVSLAIPLAAMAQDEEKEVEEAAEEIEEQLEEKAEEVVESFAPTLGTEVDEEAIEQAVEEAAEDVLEQAEEDQQPIVSEEDAEAKTKAEMKKDQTGTNPINFTFDARLYNEYQWLNTLGDGHFNITTFEFRAPYADGKWQFRSKIRYNDIGADLNDDGFDNLNDSGFGDTDIRFMTVPYLNMEKKFGVAAGVEFFFDTASEDALGAGATIVGPFVFLPIFNPLGKGSIIVPGYQHKISIDEATGREKVHQGLIDLFIVKTFRQNQFWAYVDPQILLDYENNVEFMLLELQGGVMTGKWFGPKGGSAYIMPSFGIGVDRPYDFSLEVGYKVVW